MRIAFTDQLSVFTATQPNVCMHAYTVCIPTVLQGYSSDFHQCLGLEEPCKHQGADCCLQHSTICVYSYQQSCVLEPASVLPDVVSRDLYCMHIYDCTHGVCHRHAMGYMQLARTCDRRMYVICTACIITTAHKVCSIHLLGGMHAAHT